MGRKKCKRKPFSRATGSTNQHSSTNSQKEDASVAQPSCLPKDFYDKRKLKVGDRVVMRRLKTQSFNGRLGTIQSVPTRSRTSRKIVEESSRYGILLDDGPLCEDIGDAAATIEDDSQSLVAIQAKNLVQVFGMNDCVFLHGLKNQTQYNGVGGTIIQVPDSVSNAEARYVVRLDQESNSEDHGVLANNEKPAVQEKTILQIRPENMFLANRGGMTTEEQEAEKDYSRQFIEAPRRAKEDKSNEMNQLAALRRMMNRFKDHQPEVFGRKLYRMPNFKKELFDSGAEGLPKGVDKKWADDYLRVAYEQNCWSPHIFEQALKRERYKPEPWEICKRLGGVDPKKLDWYMKAICGGHGKPGTINPNRHVNPYPAIHRHSFSNQTYRKECLHQGTTHVAVGFVDLGILLTMQLKDPPVPSASTDSSLLFVGVETSAYAVAKAHLIWEMLKQTPSLHAKRSLSSSLSFSSHDDEKEEEPDNRQLHLQFILQVWFSTTWGEGTATAVQNALSTILCNDIDSARQHNLHQRHSSDVLEILQHWHKSDLFPLETARAQKAAATSSSRSYIGHCLRRKDRIAMAQYELSGDFALPKGKQPVCGNTIMLDCPDGTPPLEKDESVFSVLNTLEVIDILRSRDHRKLSIIEAAEKYLFSKIDKLSLLVEKELVALELVCAKVEDIAGDIAAMQPWTMSWSNHILDYMDYQEFHCLARKCSIHGDTLHFAYSMNWLTEVFGTNILDFTRYPAQAPLRSLIIDQANAFLKEVFKKYYGWKHFFVCPPPTNPINTTANYILLPMHFETWANHFFSFAQEHGGGSGPCQVANVELAGLEGKSFLSTTGGSSVYLTWTYDPKCHLQDASEPRQHKLGLLHTVVPSFAPPAHKGVVERTSPGEPFREDTITVMVASTGDVEGSDKAVAVPTEEPTTMETVVADPLFSTVQEAGHHRARLAYGYRLQLEENEHQRAQQEKQRVHEANEQALLAHRLLQLEREQEQQAAGLETVTTNEAQHGATTTPPLPLQSKVSAPSPQEEEAYESAVAPVATAAAETIPALDERTSAPLVPPQAQQPATTNPSKPRAITVPSVTTRWSRWKQLFRRQHEKSVVPPASSTYADSDDERAEQHQRHSLLQFLVQGRVRWAAIAVIFLGTLAAVQHNPNNMVPLLFSGTTSCFGIQTRTISKKPPQK